MKSTGLLFSVTMQVRCQVCGFAHEVRIDVCCSDLKLIQSDTKPLVVIRAYNERKWRFDVAVTNITYLVSTWQLAK
jgi:hypothetical protein